MFDICYRHHGSVEVMKSFFGCENQDVCTCMEKTRKI